MTKSDIKKHLYRTAKFVGQGWDSFVKLIYYDPTCDNYVVMDQQGRIKTVNAIQLDFFCL